MFVFSNVASRIAGALLEHRAIEGGDELKITHEDIAKDAGTAREVVTRILKQFQSDGLVKLTRGKITIIDAKNWARYNKCDFVTEKSPDCGILRP